MFPHVLVLGALQTVEVHLQALESAQTMRGDLN